MSTRTRWVLLAGLLGVIALVGVARVYCFTVWWKYSLVIKGCPDGDLKQMVDVSASNLRRKGEGTVTVAVMAHYAQNGSESTGEVPVKDFETKLALVDAAGKETALAPKKWERIYDSRMATVELPDAPDGDYKLRARTTSKLGESSVDVPLPLYAPAKIHVITDRPLYEPGNTMKFRAVVLRARDLAPLDGRPGLWVVKDPSGEVLLEEKAPAGPWGVIAGSFPLDAGAATGQWRVSWTSADASDEVAVTVEPFTLPRFRVEATPSKPYYRAGDKPVLNGAAIYSSGAPVAGAAVEITWDTSGDWPPPTEWLHEGLLPGHAVTGPAGTFKLELPAIPADLVGQTSLVARIGVTDGAGDRVDGGAALMLVKDGIQVSAVTELDGGLVEGFNNRVYLRVTTPDGRPLGGAKINVKRAWSSSDKGVEAELDEDGVGSMQLDPGPPVNIVIPALPYRAPPKKKLVTRGETDEMLSGDGASLEDQLAMDGWLRDLEPCAYLIEEELEAVDLAIAVEESGVLGSIAAGGSDAARCAVGRLGGKRLPPGRARVLSVSFNLAEPDVPRLQAEVEDVLDVPDEVNQLAGRAARASRSCLPANVTEGSMPKALLVRVRAGKKDLELRWLREPEPDVTGEAGMACIEAKVRTSGLALAREAENDGMALVRLTVELPERLSGEKPQPTVFQGYELLVTAATDGAPATKLRIGPGTVPPLRLRASQVLAQPGDKVTFELIRGPGFSGTLPEEMRLDHLRGHAIAKVVKETRKAELTIDAEAQGWCEVRAGDARALVFVRPKSELAVALTPSAAKFKPGETAEIKVETRSGGVPGPAAVGLFGVDESLGQLASLPGPDDMGRVRATATMSAPAFGVLDAQALALGRVRGANAAAATVLRVTSIPSVPELDAVSSGNARTPFDAVAVLTDRFYTVLEELHLQTRKWEAEAPAAEKMTPATMAGLWRKSLAACAKRGDAVVDAYGRPLKLSRLPADLLALTDPRAVVALGTRLPEDVESWTDYVSKVKP